MLNVQVVMTPRCRYPVQLELIEPQELCWLMCALCHNKPAEWTPAVNACQAVCSSGQRGRQPLHPVTAQGSGCLGPRRHQMSCVHKSANSGWIGKDKPTGEMGMSRQYTHYPLFPFSPWLLPT